MAGYIAIACSRQRGPPSWSRRSSRAPARSGARSSSGPHDAHPGDPSRRGDPLWTRGICRARRAAAVAYARGRRLERRMAAELDARYQEITAKAAGDVARGGLLSWRVAELRTSMDELTARRDEILAETELARRRTSELRALSDDYKLVPHPDAGPVDRPAGHRGRAGPPASRAQGGRPRRISLCITEPRASTGEGRAETRRRARSVTIRTRGANPRRRDRRPPRTRADRGTTDRSASPRVPTPSRPPQRRRDQEPQPRAVEWPDPEEPTHEQQPRRRRERQGQRLGDGRAPVCRDRSVPRATPPRRCRSRRRRGRSTRSHPVRPAMIRMNPTVPTMTGTIIPMIRIRSASAPARNSFPKIRSVSSGRIPSTRSTGIVAASVHRVTFLYRRSSCSRSPRWCRSATNGLNVSETT